MFPHCPEDFISFVSNFESIPGWYYTESISSAVYLPARVFKNEIEKVKEHLRNQETNRVSQIIDFDINVA